jgi:putative two-component system response regulator
METNQTVVVVDDNMTNLTVAENVLTGKYNIITIPSGEKLFRLLEMLTPDLILLDINMPGMNGYEVIKKLKKSEATKSIPVIFLTAATDPEREVEGLDLGANDYITKPFTPELLQKRVEMHLLLQQQQKELLNYSKKLEITIGEKSGTIHELKNTVLKTISGLVESRDSITGGHIERTQNYLKVLVYKMIERGVYFDEISSWDIPVFIMSSQLHDVGKIAIKDCILLKPGHLTLEEFEEIKKHTSIGASIIRKIRDETTEDTFLTHAEILALNHHEKWDGTGYPEGLKGSEIPLEGRLMAIIDVYDALTQVRPYKEALSHEDAVKIILNGAGTHFDPKLVTVFLYCEKEFERIAVQGDVHYELSTINYPIYTELEKMAV